MTIASPGGAKPTSFKDIQYQFTAHIRDPENCSPPADIEDRRMQIYRDLLFNNVEDFLANSFPVLRKIMPKPGWHALIRDYFKIHQARTPLFPKMSQEFLQYLDQERELQSDDFPFMKELAHYEWLELAIFIDSRDLNMSGIDASGDLLRGIPLLSPLAWPFAYQYPVHKISPDYLPIEAPTQATYLVVYRGHDDEVGFLELNPVSARLIEHLQADLSQSGQQILEDIASELQHPDPQVVIDGGFAILQSMREKDIILGTQIV
ncbi:MAG: hypothetical protein ACI9SC_001093 [Gammaproteobacteria bacterium]